MVTARKKFLVLYIIVGTGVVVYGNPGVSSINPKRTFVPRHGVSSQQTAIKSATTTVTNHVVNNNKGSANKDPVINPVLAGKIVTAAYLLQGALLQLAPSRQLSFLWNAR